MRQYGVFPKSLAEVMSHVFCAVRHYGVFPKSLAEVMSHVYLCSASLWCFS